MLGYRQAETCCQSARSSDPFEKSISSESNLLLNESRLQCHGQPVPVLLYVHSGEPVTATVVFPVLHSFLNRTPGYDGSVSIYANLQIRNFSRLIMEGSRGKPLENLRLRAHL